jgi:1-acyl-sn-glycerol-3-phosphate acyltransferase
VSELTYCAAIAAGKVALRGLDLRVRSQGAVHLPADGPVVLACNHVSFPDFVYVGQALLGTGRHVRFLCRGDIWDSVAGRFMQTMRHVPVDREAPAGAYLQARGLLREGEVVCVFPEAGISAAYAVRAMMPGAVALARDTGAPLLPVTVWGGQRLWGQRRALDAPFPRPEVIRGRTVDVRIGEPWQVAPDADLVETTRYLGASLQATLDQLQRLPEHRPRPGEWAPWYPAHLGGDAVEREASYELDGMPRSAIRPTWRPAVN